jgi:hypothetical protein
MNSWYRVIVHISQETWAIVAATALGPIVAVIITLWREAARDKYNRRLFVFRTLMSTRRAPISNEHVNALNLIEVDFYDCKAVEAAWKPYKDHLNTGPDDEAWREKKENLLAKRVITASVSQFRKRVPSPRCRRNHLQPIRPAQAREFRKSLSLNQDCS